MRALLLGLVLSVVGCAMPEPLEPGHAYALDARGPWQAEESAQLTAACVAWAEWSNGGLLCRLAAPGEDTDGAFVRGETGIENYARLDAMARTITIDVDRMREDGFELLDVRALAANMIGQAAGMELHTGRGVLSTDNVVAEFTAEDRASCVAAGFCR